MGIWKVAADNANDGNGGNKGGRPIRAGPEEGLTGSTPEPVPAETGIGYKGGLYRSPYVVYVCC
jgi:hypothetical protein